MLPPSSWRRQAGFLVAAQAYHARSPSLGASARAPMYAQATCQRVVQPVRCTDALPVRGASTLGEVSKWRPTSAHLLFKGRLLKLDVVFQPVLAHSLRAIVVRPSLQVYAPGAAPQARHHAPGRTEAPLPPPARRHQGSWRAAECVPSSRRVPLSLLGGTNESRARIAGFQGVSNYRESSRRPQAGLSKLPSSVQDLRPTDNAKC